MTCRTPWIVPTVGLEWVTFSSPLAQASLPDFLSNARNVLPAVPP